MQLSINFGAVIVAVIVNHILGFLTYGPLFGKIWMRLEGFTHESMKSMKMTARKAMILGFISTFIMVYVLARFAVTLGVMGVSGAFGLAFWVWLGFGVTTHAIGPLWEGKSGKLFMFNIAYQFVSLLASALILVLWK